MAISKPPKPDVKGEINKLFGKAKDKLSSAGSSDQASGLSDQASTSASSGSSTATIAAGAVGATAVGAGASAAASAAPAGAASGAASSALSAGSGQAASGLSGAATSAASGLTGGSGAGASGGTSASTASGSAASGSTPGTGASGTAASTSSSSTGSATQGGATSSSPSPSTGSASGNAPGGSASSTSGGTSGGGGTSAASASSGSATGSTPSGSASSSTAPGGATSGASTTSTGSGSATSGGGSGFASTAKSSAGSAASSAASGNVPSAGSVPTSAAGVTDVAKGQAANMASKVPGASNLNNIPTSTDALKGQALGAATSKIPGASSLNNIPTTASGALGKVPGGIPTSTGGVLGKVEEGVGIAGLALGGVGLVAGAISIGATIYQLKNGLGGTAAQNAAAKVKENGVAVEMVESGSSEGASTSSSSSSSKAKGEESEFLTIQDFSKWPNASQAEFVAKSVTFDGGMSDLLGGGILEVQAKTKPSDLQKQLPDILGAPIALLFSKKETEDGSEKTVQYTLNVYVKNISYETPKDENDENTFYTYKINIVSQLWFLSLRTNCKIFQSKSAQDIIESVLKEHEINYEFKLAGTHQQYDYCVQYRESDLNFTLRLMAAEGIYCYWQYSQEGAKLILADSASTDVPQKFTTDQDTVIKHYFRPFPISYVTNSYDFTNPERNLQVPGNSTTPKSFDSIKKAEVYDPECNYTQGQNGAGGAVNKTRLNDQESGYEIIKVKGKAFNIGVGDKITFDKEDVPNEDGKEYVVIYVTRDIQDVKNCNLVYTCIPVGTVFSAKIVVDVEGEDEPLAKRFEVTTPRIEGPQLAKVVGSDGTTGVDTDEYGRIKVQFYWDKDKTSSCYIRVVHSAGMQGVPNIGTDVVVSFEGGDPNKPLVVGQVHSALTGNQPSYDLPGAKFSSMIGRKPGAHQDGKYNKYNTIVLDDTDGSQELTVTAPGKRTATVAKGDDTLTIKDGNMTITVSNGEVTITAAKGAKITTDGNLELSGKKGVKITSETGSVDIKGASTSINGTSEVKISGGVVQVG